MRILSACLPTLLTAAALWACGDDTGDTEPDAAPAGATAFTLTPAGGVFDGTGDLAGVRLTVPPDAVSADTPLWMAPPETSPPLPETGLMVGVELRFGPGTPTLAAPAELTLPFEPAQVMQAGVALQLVKVWRLGPDGWVIEEPSAVPSEAGVTVRVDTLDQFAAGVEIE